MTTNDLFDVALAMLSGLGLKAADRHRGAVRIHRLSDPGPSKLMTSGVWEVFTRPGALATNFRLIESHREVDRSRWSKSRIGDGEIVHTTLINDYLHRAVARGATLVVNHVDELDASVRCLCEALEYLLLARVWANCYITVGTDSAFNTHFDDHDALILQLQGRKRWQVDRTVGARSAQLPDDPLDVVLEPGTCLCVARDTTHRVSGMGELSVHLTFGFDRYAGLEARVTDAYELLGMKPRSLAPEDLRRQLALLPDRRNGTSFPAAVTSEPGDSARVRWASRFPPLIARQDGGILVISRGRKFRLDVRLADTIDALAEGREYRWPLLRERSRLAESDLREFVAFGIRHDFLICQG